MKLNQRNAAALKLPSGKPEHFYWDDDLRGFGLRVRREGNRTWVVGYRVRRGRYRRLTLGDVAKLNAEQARTEAKRIFGDVARGIDPLAERQAKQLGAARSLGAVIDDYLTRKAKELRPASLRNARLYLQGWHFKPLHSHAVTDIKRIDIAGRLDKIADAKGPTTARAARAALSAFFASAWKKGIVESNPVLGTESPAPGASRERVLTDAELRAIWNACGDGDYGRVVRLLILTGQRRNEIGGLRWGEIGADRDGKAVILLAADRTKNRHSHVVPLLPMAQKIIDSVPKRGDFLFGSAGFTGWSAGKAALDERLKGKVADFRLHDVRRTVATKMAESPDDGGLGIEPHIVEALLNHLDGHKSGVAGVYNRAGYKTQIRAALALWNDHLRSLVEGGGRKLLRFAKESA
jgi:integrase